MLVYHFCSSQMLWMLFYSCPTVSELKDFDSMDDLKIERAEIEVDVWH